MLKTNVLDVKLGEGQGLAFLEQAERQRGVLAKGERTSEIEFCPESGQAGKVSPTNQRFLRSPHLL